MKDQPEPLEYSVPEDHPPLAHFDYERGWDRLAAPADGRGRFATHLFHAVATVLVVLLVIGYIRSLVHWLTL